MIKPITLVTGVHPEAMMATTLSLLLELPNSVVIRYRIDLERVALIRLVSDLSGVIEHQEVDLDDTCVSCVIRDDLLFSLRRLVQDSRWDSLIAQFPVGATAAGTCAAVHRQRMLPMLQINSVVTAIEGSVIEVDLLGDQLLADRGQACFPNDRRGVGETLAELVEYADLIITTESPQVVDSELLRVLARPGAKIIHGSENTEASAILQVTHDFAQAHSWSSPMGDLELPSLSLGDVWRLELRSPQPFHPQRLLQQIHRLGGGRHRSKGFFWLPTRPRAALEWVGAGGQLSIGTGPGWGRKAQETRLVITGVGKLPPELAAAFSEVLLQPGEEYDRAGFKDGFEPWLGPIHNLV